MPTARAALVADADAVDEVVRQSPWPPARGLDRLGPTVPTEDALALARAALSDETGVAVVVEDGHGRVSGWTAARPRPWESEMLGVDTWVTSAVATMVDHPEGDAVTAAALDELVQLAGARGAQLVQLRVDAEDAATLAVAQQAGFAIWECSLAYLNDAERSCPAQFPPPPGVELTRHRGDIRDQVDPADWEALIRRTLRWDYSHLRSDPRVPVEGAIRLYRAWVEKILTGEFADRVVLAKQGDRTIGYYSLHLDDGFAARTGVPLCTQSLSAVTSESRGVFGALLADACDHAALGARWAEFPTQTANLPILVNLNRHRSLRLVRSSYTLHRWIGG